MRFLILRRRKLGVAIPADQLRKMQPLAGDIQISECHDAGLGRSTVSAWIFSSGPGADVFPRLLDVKITGMAQVGMNLTGTEEVDGAYYAQSWWCRVE
ncbi:hypothetical protein [Pseudomonas donghuensis]|uniref:hypothetical protein n=1 Tax=Pseudomonas donghuensis TaxID=1163398 RepID=UPI0020C57812|nr:hypothetical protein [Pseudomonas donghuensis]MCP6694642.1 hypothetical protein [Pseudomonas donghuensis]